MIIHILGLIISNSKCSTVWLATTMNDVKAHVKEAIEKGNLSELDHLLEDSPEWDIRSEHLQLSHYTGGGGKQTALHLACMYGHLNIVEYLVLGRGCSVTQTNLGGLTPLVLAWSYKHWEVMLCLLNYIQEKGFLQGKSPSRLGLSVEAIIPRFLELAPFEESFLRAACKLNLLHALQCLCKMKRNSPGLHASWRVACVSRDLPTMQFIIKYGKSFDHEMPDLHKACLLGDELVAIKMINESQSGINSLVETDKYGMTPVHYASCEPHLLRLLVRVGEQMCDDIGINMEQFRDTAMGNTPLHYAVMCGCLESLDVLASLCGSLIINIKNNKGCTPLHLSVKQLNMLVALLKYQQCSINETDDNGETALHMACRGLNVECVRALIQNERCDQNIQLGDGSTALHIAVHSTYTVYQQQIVQVLMESDETDPSINDNAGQTPLQCAIASGKLNVVGALISSGKCRQEYNIINSTLLHKVVESNKPQLLSALLKYLDNDCNINEKNDKCETALHEACRGGNLECIRVLIGDGKCDPNIQLSDGSTALHVAVSSDYHTVYQHEVVQCLLESIKIDTNLKDHSGLTPLHIAAIRKSFKTATLLFKHSTHKPNLQDNDGNTPLHLSVGSLYAVKLFLSHASIDLNIQNNTRQTPLHLAIRKDLDITDVILKHSKCNPNAQDIDGNTPLHLAVVLNSPSHIKHLLSHPKIGVNIQNREGNTPMHEAVIRRASSVVNTLLLHKDCDISKKDGEGKAQLQLALLYAFKLDIIEALLANDKIELQYIIEGSREKMWIFNNALLHNHPILVKKCIEFGCSVNDGVLGVPPLHIVCREGHEESCLLLLQCKEINVLAQNQYGNAPIHIACLYLKEKCLGMLLDHKMCDPNQANLNGDTPFHILCGSQKPSEKLITLLLSNPEINLECVNDHGLTPLDRVPQSNTSRITMISKCLRLKQVKLETYLKIFVLGNSGNGKSTLIKAITTEAFQLLKFVARRVNPRDVPPHTAGIVPIPFNSKHFGHAVLYDFAGQHEYYSSHAAVIENLILPSPPLFLLLIDISKPMEKIKEELMYWWLYIDNHCQRAMRIPHAILVGSHKDIARLNGEDPHRKMKDITENIMNKKVSFTLEGYFLLDCRKLASKGLTGLLNQLRTTCQTLRETADIDLHCNILKAFCVENFDDETVACKFSDIIMSEHFILSQNPPRLISLLSTLSDKGHILLLHNHTDVNKSWVILKPSALLTEVNGSIFAPENFKEHCSHGFAMSTGVIALTNIKEKFSNVNDQVITGYLTHMEYCFEIKDQHTLELITNDPALKVHSEEEEVYYFFPGLVQTENPKDVYQPQDGITYFECGWLCKCYNKLEQLTTRFLHVLILRLAFAFSCQLPDATTERESVVLLRSCSVWKHGIAWWTNDGIETIVEVDVQCRWVAVMMRCPDTHKVQCAELRSKVIATVLKTKKDFCPAITMNDFLISPSSLRYPFQGRELTLYSMSEIANVVIDGKDFARDIEGKNPLRVSLLLPFEPYFSMGSVTNELFSTNQSICSQELSGEDLLRVSEFCCKNLESFEIALKPSLTAYEDECSRAGDSRVRRCAGLFQILQRRGCKTWRDFEREFSIFSIFCGRNPMVTIYYYPLFIERAFLY